MNNSIINQQPNYSSKSDTPLKLAVVGHTNTGKTSILRTLLRDSYFGEVKNTATTTRHVERAIIKSQNVSNQTKANNLISLFDTPGLEDASGVLDWLEENTDSALDGVDRLKQFLACDHAYGLTEDDFSQESKIIRKLLNSDIAIYVIDAREAVMGKYKDELTILSWVAIPVMPVFNFTTTRNNNISDWQYMLARRNLHVSTQFDSVAFNFSDEIRLWNSLAAMLGYNSKINTLITNRKYDWQRMSNQGQYIIADFLINVASYSVTIDEDEDPLISLHVMQSMVREAEKEMHAELLDLYKFYDNEVTATLLNLHEYQQDPFDKEVLKRYGIRTSSGAAAGAIIGMGIDTLALGSTLGLGTAIGSMIGSVLSNSNKISDALRGKKQLFIDPITITLLATRASVLHNKLRHRGHATLSREIATKTDDDIYTKFTPWQVEKIPKELKKARHKIDWSSLSGNDEKTSKALRESTAWLLSEKLIIEEDK